MTKTLTVNLGGTVFQIDEDAYILLDNYLNNLRFHFRKEEGGEEIVRDMEMRISELFSEGMEGGQQVVTIDNVETVIARMGRPEQLDDETNETSYAKDGSEDKRSETEQGHSDEEQQTRKNEHSGTKNYGWNHTEASHDQVKKRLYRDVDNRILGGVISGIAAYFGWDPTALRLVFILLGFLPSGPSMLLIYLVLLFIIPPARTATEKLRMRGQPINMENIGKTVTDGFEREKNAEAGRDTRTGFQRFLDALVSIIGLFLKVFLGLLLICCIPILIFGFLGLFTLILSGLGIFVHLPSVCWHLMPNIPWDVITGTPVTGSFFLLSALLVAGIPLMVILQLLLQNFGYGKYMGPKIKLSLVLVWFVALVALYIFFFLLF